MSGAKIKQLSSKFMFKLRSNSRKVVMPESDLTKVYQYADRLHQGISDTVQLCQFRENQSKKFRELCNIHLSFLIEIPCDFFDNEVGCSSIYNKDSEKLKMSKNNRNQQSSIARFFFNSNKTNVAKIEPIPENVVNNMKTVFEFLLCEYCLSVEGIFRKSGHVHRQRELRNLILSSHSLTTEDLTRPQSCYNVHDVAGALKSVLTDLQEPLLTSRYLKLFSQIAALNTFKTDDHGVYIPRNEVDTLIIRGKQLKALRILILLLPETHRTILQHLLKLLNAASKLEENRMSAESLGTLFGPLLLTPKKISSKELRIVYPVFNQLATFMIQQGEELFLIPVSLAEDISLNMTLQQVNEINNQISKSAETSVNDPTCQMTPISTNLNFVRGPSKRFTDAQKETACHSNILYTSPYFECKNKFTECFDEDDCIETSIAFVDRKVDKLSHLNTPNPKRDRPVATSPVSGWCISALNNHNDKNTEFAVAELYAQVQGLPESSTKSRLVHKFNQVNGGLTPQRTSEFLRSTAHARGIRSSLRKRLAKKIPMSKPALSEKSFTYLKDALSSHDPLFCIRNSQDYNGSPTLEDYSFGTKKLRHSISKYSSTVSLSTTSYDSQNFSGGDNDSPFELDRKYSVALPPISSTVMASSDLRNSSIQLSHQSSPQYSKVPCLSSPKKKNNFSPKLFLKTKKMSYSPHCQSE